MSNSIPTKNIENFKDFAFIAQTFMLIEKHRWNQGADLAGEIRTLRKRLRAAQRAFDATENMPCGYQDSAGERCERIGEQYMQTVHAFLSCKYGSLTKRMTMLLDHTLVS